MINTWLKLSKLHLKSTYQFDLCQLDSSKPPQIFAFPQFLPSTSPFWPMLKLHRVAEKLDALQQAAVVALGKRQRQQGKDPHGNTEGLTNVKHRDQRRICIWFKLCMVSKSLVIYIYIPDIHGYPNIWFKPWFHDLFVFCLLICKATSVAARGPVRYVR